MERLRLTMAREAGLIALPDGPVAVLGVQADTDLSGLEGAALETRFRPDFDALERRGLAPQTQLDGRFAAALVQIPRARVAARAAIARAAGMADLVLVEGSKTDGIEGLARDLKSRTALQGNWPKAHGRLLWFTGNGNGADDFSDWLSDAEARDIGGWITRPGVFSADGPDRGSVLLADNLPPLKGRVADLGAGWGYLASRVLGSDAVTELALIEADLDALDCARLNVTDPRARFLWDDATKVGPGPFDTVITNPPFHTSRNADPSLGRAFIAAARAMLKPSGQLFLVANRHLPYEGALNDSFAEVAEIAGDPAFKLYRAARPRRQK